MDNKNLFLQAKKGSLNALHELVNVIVTSTQTIESESKIIDLLRKTSERNDAESMYLLAKILDKRPRYLIKNETSLKWFIAASNQNHLESTNYVADYYKQLAERKMTERFDSNSKDTTIEKSYASKSEFYYKRALQLGDDKARCSLFYLYQHFDDPRAATEGITLLQEGVRNNDYLCMLKYADLCTTGYLNITPVDYQQAAELYSKVLDAGYKYAGYQIAILELEGHIERKSDFNELANYFQWASESVSSEKGYYLAKLYLEDSNATSEQVNQAIGILNNLMMEHEDTRAILYLADCYFNGRGVIKNNTKAIEMIQGIVEIDDDAAFYLADVFLTGKYDVPANQELAFEYYSQCGYIGYSRLAMCYENGYGTNKDLINAIGLYEKSLQYPKSEYSKLRLSYWKILGYPVSVITLSEAYDYLCEWLNYDSDGEVNLIVGLVLHFGWLGQKDSKKANELFIRSSQSGNLTAQWLVHQTESWGDTSQYTDPREKLAMLHNQIEYLDEHNNHLAMSKSEKLTAETDYQKLQSSSIAKIYSFDSEIRSIVNHITLRYHVRNALVSVVFSAVITYTLLVFYNLIQNPQAYYTIGFIMFAIHLLIKKSSVVHQNQILEQENKGLYYWQIIESEFYLLLSFGWWFIAMIIANLFEFSILGYKLDEIFMILMIQGGVFSVVRMLMWILSGCMIFKKVTRKTSHLVFDKTNLFESNKQKELTRLKDTIIEPTSRKIAFYDLQVKTYSQLVQSFNFIHSKYKSTKVLSRLFDYFVENRASNLTEAINLWELEDHQRKLLEQNEQLVKAQKEANTIEKQKVAVAISALSENIRHNSAIERQNEEYTSRVQQTIEDEAERIRRTLNN